MKAGHTKTEAYVDERRGLGARFCAKFYLGAAGVNSSTPTAQLESLSAFLAVIAYIQWDFRVTVVTRAFLKPNPLGREVFASPPLFSEQTQRRDGDY